MPGNTFGQLFRVTTFGESHGELLGAVIDGCPAGLKLNMEFVQAELARRRPGQSKLTTQRKEADLARCVSGVFEGVTTGTPLTIVIQNEDQRSSDYRHLVDRYRPSHADFTYEMKYGHRDYRGGGRASARETAARVAAGAVAKLLLHASGLKIIAYVSQVGSIAMDPVARSPHIRQIEATPVRCPDPRLASEMISLIESVKKNGDTVGGVVSCIIENCPMGLGEPVFDRLSADLAKAMFSIPAVKGFELGSGFNGVKLSGSAHNDVFVKKGRKIVTKTNQSGGIQGGISNGMNIEFRVAFKPVATLLKTQLTVNNKGRTVEIEGRGRHDACVVPRAVPIVEAMAAITLADHFLRNNTARL